MEEHASEQMDAGADEVRASPGGARPSQLISVFYGHARFGGGPLLESRWRRRST